MPLEIAVWMEGLPEGEMVGIPGLGRFENGGAAVEIDPDREIAFVQANGMHVRDAFAEQEGITISGTRAAKDEDIPESAEPAEGTRDAEEGDLVENPDVPPAENDLVEEGDV